MPVAKIKSYIRKNPNPGVYKSVVGEGNKAKTIEIHGSSVYNTNDAEVIKFLNQDPGVVLAELEPIKPVEEDEGSQDSSAGEDNSEDAGEDDPG